MNEIEKQGRLLSMESRMVGRYMVLPLVAMFALLGELQAMDRQQFETLARECAADVHPDTLAAIIKTESSFNPFAININGDQQLPRQPADVDEAIATAAYLSENAYNFDAGLGQINSANVATFNMSWADVFEPCANLAAAARVLTECFARTSDADPQVSLRQALSCYNTGSLTRGHQNGYVARVERSAGIVPALIPLSVGVDDSSLDAFDRHRMDAFKRSSGRVRMERELRFSDLPPRGEGDK